MIKQIIVPAVYRESALKLAYESVIGGHLVTQKSADKILTQFFGHVFRLI